MVDAPDADPTQSPRPEMGRFAGLIHERRLNRLEDLENREDFLSALGDAALTYAGVVPATGSETLIYPRPESISDKPVRQELASKIEERVVGDTKELKEAAGQIPGFDRANEIIKNTATRIPITKKWVKEHEVHLKDKLDRGEISRFKYDEEVAHLDHLKPKGSSTFGHRHFRPRERESDPVKLMELSRRGKLGTTAHPLIFPIFGGFNWERKPRVFAVDSKGEATIIPSRVEQTGGSVARPYIEDPEIPMEKYERGVRKTAHEKARAIRRRTDTHAIRSRIDHIENKIDESEERQERKRQDQRDHRKAKRERQREKARWRAQKLRGIV